MQTLTMVQTRRAGSLAPPIAVAAVATGLGLVAMSLAVPWITVFRGLQPIPGFTLEGGPLAGFAMVALLLLAVAATIGGSRWLKPVAFLIAATVSIGAVLLQVRIADYVANPGPAGPLTQPTAGVGAALMAVGAAFFMIAAVALPGRATRLDTHSLGRVAMSLGLLVAGWIHLLLVPEHLAESTVLGLGFLASGIAQLVLAAVVLWRPREWSLALVVAINVTLIAIYAYAVLVGLPFGQPSEHAEAAGLVVGAGEPIDWFGAISKVAELVSLAIAFTLLTPKTLQNPLDPTN